MTTPEQRITSLEFDLKQFRTETLKAYTDLVYEVTILKGFGEDSIKQLSAMRREMEAPFDRQDAMLQTLLERLPPAKE